MKEPCIKNCKFIKNERCTLYHTKLMSDTFPDPYDNGRVLTLVKCDDCREKEISCSIDNKIRDIYSFYQAFTEEMDIQFQELDAFVIKRKSIYKED